MSDKGHYHIWSGRERTARSRAVPRRQPGHRATPSKKILSIRARNINSKSDGQERPLRAIRSDDPFASETGVALSTGKNPFMPSFLLRLKPNYLAALHNRGLVFNEKGEYERAVDDFTAVLQVDSQNPRVLFRRGQALMKKGSVEAANADISAARAIKPDIAEAIARAER
jgi:tetratricopeptide (TPR) repeat protein